jgi:DNA-binding response OmpR family regulator
MIPSASMIRTVIVDDEPPARRRLETLLRSHPDIDIIAECGDGEEALRVVNRERPDLLFLDIQMSTIDGLDMARSLSAPKPVIIFVTAYDDYAVGAFDVAAVDYLLKPFDEERFTVALDRARQHVLDARTMALHARVVALFDEAANGTPSPGFTRRRDIIRVADLEIDVSSRDVRRAGVLVPLRPKLVDLLVALARYPGEVVSRHALLRAVWGYKDDVVSRTLDTHLAELRRKLGHTRDEPGYIETVLKTGYRLIV